MTIETKKTPKVLKVNLSEGTIESTNVPENIERKYLGGKGFGIYTVHQYLKKYKAQGVYASKL